MHLLPCPPHLASTLVEAPPLEANAPRGRGFHQHVVELAETLAGTAFDRDAARSLREAMVLPPPFREFVFPGAAGKPRVVVIDEPHAGASADECEKLLAMLDAAERENPGATVALLATTTREDDGVLASSAKQRGYPLLSATTDIAELALQVDRAYTVRSAAGWQLLLCGVPIRCFGTSFYAGWGLTDDESNVARHEHEAVDLDVLVEAAMVRSTRYRDPYTGETIDALGALDIARDMARIVRMNAQIGSFYRFLSWKRGTIARMFADGSGKQVFSRFLFNSLSTARLQRKCLVAWASSLSLREKAQIERSGVKYFRMEDGFIRSVGLGASGYQPLSLVVDDRGIYYDGSAPSRLEAILAMAHFDPRLVARAQALIELMLSSRITKYNLAEASSPLRIPSGRKVIFVPGQVEDDASILLGADGMRARTQLEIIRRENPDAFIVYKPHPDVAAGLRKGLANSQEALEYVDLYVENHSVLSLVEAADEIHTITSLTGFEALLRGKRVVCYGKPFYAGWGLTKDMAKIERRNRKLTLEEMAAGTLILYPHYLDPVSGLPASPEVAIQRIRDYCTSPAKPDVLMHIRASVRSWLRQLTARR